MAIHAHNVGLRRGAVTHMGHLANGDGGAMHRLHRQLVEFGNGFGAVVELHVVLVCADLGRTDRDDLVLRRQCIAHVLRGQPLGGKRLRIQVQRYLPLRAAIRRGHRHARHRGQRRAHQVQAKVENLRL